MLDNVIEVLKKLNELNTAKILLNTFAKYAHNIEEYDNLGRWFMEIKDYPSAIKYAEKALINTPSNEGMYACRSNLAKLYNHINNPTASLRYSTANLSINPGDYESLLEQVFSFFLLNDKKRSETILRELKEHSDLPEEVLHRVNFNLGTYDLYKGEFQKGLRGFLIEGKKIGIWKNITLPFKFWDGGVQPDKTIIICAEGGIGDELINIRFIKHFQKLGMNPIWYTTRIELVELFKRHGIDARSSLQDVPKDALWTYSMSIPVFLDLQPKDLWDGPYITANPEYITKWDWIAQKADNKQYVGIRWTGNPEYEQDLHRTVPVSNIIECLHDFKYDIFSIQRDYGADQIVDYPSVYDLADKLETIEDTLAVIHHLDFVITSCTSIVHMAASMGKKVFVLVPITAYYVWASTTDTSSIWYGDNVKVLRQITHKSWDEPITQLKNLLVTL